MNKKIKEIIEALEFMGKVGEVSKIAVDNLKTGLEELNEQLTLTDVVASLLCVDSEGLSFIMEGETYDLLDESDTLYKIKDDDGDEFWYDKKHFVKNKN
jgi:dihydroxyacetone kinase-like predicted kinase